MSLLFGDYLGTEYVASDKATETIKLKSGETTAIRVIRAGERGLLYIDNEKRSVNFIQWGDVQSISTNERVFLWKVLFLSSRKS